MQCVGFLVSASVVKTFIVNGGGKLQPVVDVRQNRVPLLPDATFRNKMTSFSKIALSGGSIWPIDNF